MISIRNWQAGVAALLVVGGTSAAEAAVIAYWDYNDSNLIVDQGAGTMTVTGPAPAYGAGTTLNAQPGVAAGNAFAVPGGATFLGSDSFAIDFAIDTRGFTGLSFTYALRADPSWVSSSFRPLGIQVTYFYSTDGGLTFTPLLQFTPLADFIDYGFGLPAAMEDNADVIFRIAQNTFGSLPEDYFLIDNVTFNGLGEPPPPTAVPAPPALALFGLGMVALAAGRRRLPGRPQ